MSLARSSLMGVIASLVMGASLIVPIRIGIDVIGPNEVGAWTMIQGVFIICRLPEMGVGLNLTRAVAAERKSGEEVNPRPYIWAAGFLTIVPVFLIGCILFVSTPTVLDYLFTQVLTIDIVRGLCLLSLIIAFFSTISTILLSIIEGYGYLIHRQVMVMVSNLALLLFASPLVTKLGVIGLALTYALSSLALLVFSIIAVSKISKGMKNTKTNFKYIIKELWYGNMQVAAMAATRLTYEPLTKLVVGTFSSLALVVYVDLAMKLTLQVRVLVQSAVQPLLVYGARRTNESHHDILETFERAQILVIRSNLLLMSCQFLSSGAISFIVFNKIVPMFIAIYLMLVIGNGVNSFGIIGYYYNMSAGKMGEIISIHVKMMLINSICGALGGWLFGASVAVAAYAGSFAFGGAMLYRIWSRAYCRKGLQVLKVERWQIISAFLCLLLSIIGFLRSSVVVNDFKTSAAGLVLASFIAGWFLLNNWQALRGRIS